MGRDVEPAGFGKDQGVFVGLGRRQGGGGIQLDQFIFEHAFNIWVGADTPQRLGVSQSNGQHQIDPDNTRVVDPRHLPSGLRHPPKEVAALDRVRRQIESSSICNVRLARTPGAPKEVSTSCVEEVVALEVIGKRFHQG
jgi:hypothetical protein